MLRNHMPPHDTVGWNHVLRLCNPLFSFLFLLSLLLFFSPLTSHVFPPPVHPAIGPYRQ